MLLLRLLQELSPELQQWLSDRCVCYECCLVGKENSRDARDGCLYRRYIDFLLIVITTSFVLTDPASEVVGQEMFAAR